MSGIDKAIAEGRFALAVSGALLRDEQVVLALKDREALAPMALTQPPVPPSIPVGDVGMARAIAAPGGVLAVVEPGPADTAELDRLVAQLATAPNKPRIVVVTRKMDFALQMRFRGFDFQHVKDRGATWLAGLPTPPEGSEAPVPTVPKASERRKTKQDSGPAFAFVGREEEQAALVELLGSEGPVVLLGPRTVGRTWLLDHAVDAAELTRVADLRLARSVGFDTLIARLAQLTKAAGASQLADALSAGTPAAQLVDAAIEALQAAESLANTVFCIHGLDGVSGRDGSFWRTSRLELLVRRLLTTAVPLKLVFTATRRPSFFSEGEAQALRVYEVGGIKGRFFHEIFEAYGAADVPRDRFGPISERVHGHPYAARLFAIAVSRSPKLAQDDKFFRLEGLDDEKGLAKQIEKRLAKLDDSEKDVVARLSHLQIDADGALLAELGVRRKLRNRLQAAGVLDMLGTAEGAKRYRVHPLVRRQIPLRAISDFRIFERIGGILHGLADKETDELRALELRQEGNRCLVSGRRDRQAKDLGVPDHDAWLDGVLALLRGKSPRTDLAGPLLAEVLKANPHNADAHLAKLELLRAENAKKEAVAEAGKAALEAGPVPETFHAIASVHFHRNDLEGAIEVLKQGVEAFPTHPRLKTRLASLLLRQGGRPSAKELLEDALREAPLLADTYGLLGALLHEEGVEQLERAEDLLREAVRLAPEDDVQIERLVDLLLDLHRGLPERREALGTEIVELLEERRKADDAGWRVYFVYAKALRVLRSELDRARWLLKEAKKRAPKRRSLPAAFELESIRLKVAGGQLEDAERALRKLVKDDPSAHEPLVALSEIFEARGQLAVAHAELKRAASRVAPVSLERAALDMKLNALEEAIRAEAAGLAKAPAPKVETPAAEAPKAEEPKAEAPPVEEAAPAEAAPAEAAPTEAPEAAETTPEEAEAAPVEAAPETPAVEAAPSGAAPEPPTAEPAPPEDTDETSPKEG